MIRDTEHREHAEALHRAGALRCSHTGNGVACSFTASGKAKAEAAGLLRALSST